ncbi:MAG TPA: vWA domain-containing protein, partial [Polyangiaceae bacterium]|nr:vWA domain-containing protein [Polyangiaceae bacterium]
MSERARRLLWGAFLVLLGVGLWIAYQRFVLSAGPIKWTRDGTTYELLDPRTLGVVLLLPLLLFVLGRSLADLPWQQRVLSVLLRLAFLAALGLSLARLARTVETQQVATVFLVDVSDSVQDAALEQARDYVAKAFAAKGADDLVRVVTFAERPRLVDATPKDGKLELPEVAELRHRPDPARPKHKPGAGSDIQAALQHAYGVLPAGYLKRAVLLTDGVETRGDVLAEAARARQFGVRLFTVPYRQPPPGEVALKAVRLPQKVDVGQPFDITAEVYASRKTEARARLYQGETLNGLDAVRELSLEPGNNEIKFK